jgi:hypothetical protein
MKADGPVERWGFDAYQYATTLRCQLVELAETLNHPHSLTHGLFGGALVLPSFASCWPCSNAALLRDGGSNRQNGASPKVRELRMPASGAPSRSTLGKPIPARVTLPGNLPEALKYVDDAQLRKLLDAVAAEISRRRQAAPQKPASLAQSSATSSRGQSMAGHVPKADGIDEVPQGKANFIRASFKAGVKPAAIARTLRISQSAVRRILDSPKKPQV